MGKTNREKIQTDLSPMEKRGIFTVVIILSVLFYLKVKGGDEPEKAS